MAVIFKRNNLLCSCPLCIQKAALSNHNACKISSGTSELSLVNLYILSLSNRKVVVVDGDQPANLKKVIFVECVDGLQEPSSSYIHCKY